MSNSTVSGNSTVSYGGGIENVGGTLTVTNSTISGNGSYQGGGIDNQLGVLTISNSTVSGNSAPSGNGGGIESNGTLSISNSTINGNSAGGAGGGITNYAGTLTVSNSTLSSNSATQGSGIYGAPNPHSKVSLVGTIVANNTGSFNCAGSIAEILGYNLDSDGSCGFTLTTDITGTDPLLGPLADNGGPTQTMALLPGSPAIDRGGTAANGCPATDQRGVTRPQGPACDIGAFELVP
jgi:hypothetical protein